MMQLEIQGDITLNLQSGGYRVADGFTPETPAGDAQAVTDAFSVYITGSSASDLRAKLAALQRLADYATRYGKSNNRKTYVNFSPDSTTPWRSRIRAMTVLHESVATRRWLSNNARVKVVLEHDPWWEGPLTAVPLSNRNGTATTDPLLVYLITDSQSGRDGFVDIDGASIEGDLPAPIKLLYKNTYNNVTFSTQSLYLMLNVHSSPSDLSCMLEGEAAVGGGSVLPVSPNYASYSNGQYIQGNVLVSESRTMAWIVTGATLELIASNIMQIAGRFSIGGMWAKLKLSFGLITIVGETPWVWITGNNNLESLGLLRLPPYLVTETGPMANLYIELWTKRPAGAATVSVDYLQLCPLDAWRNIVHAGYGIQYNDTLEDDQIEDTIHTQLGGYQVAYGGKISLHPGRDQRLYITADGTSYPSRTGTVQIFYRPRRRSL
jgi:hypothetical protein